jgi:hypothetical protein
MPSHPEGQACAVLGYAGCIGGDRSIQRPGVALLPFAISRTIARLNLLQQLPAAPCSSPTCRKWTYRVADCDTRRACTKAALPQFDDRTSIVQPRRCGKLGSSSANLKTVLALPFDPRAGTVSRPKWRK